MLQTEVEGKRNLANQAEERLRRICDLIEERESELQKYDSLLADFKIEREN